MVDPIAPSLFLPPLRQLSEHDAGKISHALNAVRNIYSPPKASFDVAKQFRLNKHFHHEPAEETVIDSGYASADETEPVQLADNEHDTEDGDEDQLDALRSDTLQREFALKWLTGFLARSDEWAYSIDEEDEMLRREIAVDNATAILASFTEPTDEEQPITRTFTFQLGAVTRTAYQNSAKNMLHVELNDAPLLQEDHTSVGLQSWGSCIVLAERLCADPARFGLCDGGKPHSGLRVLELGAGTGLLSIAAAKLLSQQHNGSSTIVATDYHPDVLDNLQANVETNFPMASPVDVRSLDWSMPSFQPPLHRPFDVVLAADVIYLPEHATWIKSCVEHLLQRPNSSNSNAEKDNHGGVFWLIVPVRTTGRHEHIADTVDLVFGDSAPSADLSEAGSVNGAKDAHKQAVSATTEAKVWRLAILSREELGRMNGVGRVDEGCYRLFRIGWVES